MFFISNCCLCIFSLLILFIIYASAVSQNNEFLFQDKLYLYLVKITILLIIANFLGRFDGKPDTIYPVLNYLGNLVLFLFQLFLPCIWLLYAHYQIFYDKRKIKKLAFRLLILILINAVFVILSQFNGWVYYIDSDNIYHSGFLYYVFSAVNISMMLGAFILVISNRKKIEYEYFYSLAFFVIPPIISLPLQVIFFDIDILLHSTVLSLLIIFINIQNRKMNVDYLTGAYNRKQLDNYINRKIRRCSKGNSFSAMLIDLDDFKKINDSFGHDMGDDALIMSVDILRQNIRRCDFIARFGGDEFYIVLDINDQSALEEIVCKINCSIDNFNSEKSRPYKLGFSMGYLIYDYGSDSKINAENFLKQIDNLMYENKRAKKALDITDYNVERNFTIS